MEKGIEIRHIIIVRNNETGEKYELTTASTYNVEWACFNAEYIVAWMEEDFEALPRIIARLKSES